MLEHEIGMLHANDDDGEATSTTATAAGQHLKKSPNPRVNESTNVSATICQGAIK
jgi:hypothetical protein